MQKAVELAEKKYGKIDGVIHTAGVVEGNSFAGINFLSVAECEKQFEPKVTGVHVLEELFKNRELDFCLFTSSLSAIIGGKEFGSYASANAYLDCFSRKGRIKNSISINFDGLNFDETLHKESTLNPSEIIKILEKILLINYVPQIIISLYELDHRIKKWVYPKPDLNNKIHNADQFIPIVLERANLSTTYSEPKSETEKELCQMFQSFFGIKEIGIDDDFFELGMDSLKAMTLIGRIHQKLNVELRIKDMLEHPTIRNLVKEIDLLAKITQMQQERTMKSLKNKIEL
jgi:acyl carrier protein